MNHVIAQGAPNSLIRFFQENPQEGVDLLNKLDHISNRLSFKSLTSIEIELINEVADSGVTKCQAKYMAFATDRCLKT